MICDYTMLYLALADGSADVLLSLREELTQEHAEKTSQLQKEYDDNLEKLKGLYESKVDLVNASSESQLEELVISPYIPVDVDALNINYICCKLYCL